MAFLFSGSATESAVFLEAFKAGMRDLGWIEGRNIEYRPEHAEGQVQRMDALATRIVSERPDVIVAGTPQTT
ncbi:MAG TPA: hypothetical protein VHL79_22830, partial [Ramlibacter sp.]|nr:hypothetical protein [Ramlibacter sp.]